MTTHPPGQPTGPTGPGRTDTPGSPDAALHPSDGLGANPLDAFLASANADMAAALDEVVDTEAGLRRVKGLPVAELLDEADRIAAEPLPRLGEVVREVERLLAQAAAVLRREVDPASEPTVMAWPALVEDVLVHRLLLDEVAAQLNFALHKLDKVANLPLPPVGSAVKVPSAAEVDALRLAELIRAAKSGAR